MKLFVLWIFCLFVEQGTAQISQCGGVNINSRTTICCNGLTYVRSGPRPSCCGNVGFDAHNYYCCGKTIIRKDRYKVPRCCGEQGYDGMFDVCVDGYLDKKSELGSHCCMTEMGWKCCRRGGNCCSYSGSGQVEIPGFRPACCDLRSYTEKAQCCANTVEMTSVMPTCCDNERYRPKCCVGKDGSTECCPASTGTCCRHQSIPEPLRPNPTRSPQTYAPIYPVATPAPFTRTRSEEQCCTSTRRSCCSKPISRNALQPCCYSLNKPTCCYTVAKYQMSCCSMNGRKGAKHDDMPKLQTAKVGGRNRNNQYYPQSGGSYDRSQQYNRNNRYNYNSVSVTRRPSYNQNYYTRHSYGNQHRNEHTRYRSSNRYNTRRPSYDQNVHHRNRYTRKQQFQYTTRTTPFRNQNRYNYYRTRQQNRYSTDRPSYNHGYTPDTERPLGNVYSTKAPTYNRDRYRTCCNALAKTMCCIEGYRNTGRVPRCCPSSTTNGKMRPIYRTPDPVFKPEGNQAFHGIHYNQNPTDWMPQEEIMEPKEYMDPNIGSNRLKTRKPETEPKFIPDYGYASFGGGYSRDNKDNIPKGPQVIIGKTTDEPQESTMKQIHLDIKVYKPTKAPNSPSSSSNEDTESLVETTTPSMGDEVRGIVTQPFYREIHDNQNKDEHYNNKTSSSINIEYNEVEDNQHKITHRPFPYLTDKNGIISESDLINPEGEEINDEDENEYILVPLPEEPPLEFKPDYYNNYLDNYDYEHFKCNGDPYDLGVHICCDGVLRFRYGVEPKCCSTEAYDAFIYKCCDGVIRRSCDPQYEPKKTAWGKFV